MKLKKQKNRIKAALILLICLMIVSTVSGCHNNDKELIEDVEQLNQSQYTISVHPGSAAALVATELFPNAKIVYNNAISDAYLAVEQGKSDAFVYGKVYMQYAVASDSLDNLAIMNETLSETDIAVGINPDREDLLPEINAFIEEIRQDGTLDDMYNRWVVHADTNMPDISKPENPQRVIRVGTSGLVEPMNYYDENQELTGFDLELIYRLAYYLDAEVIIEAMSFDALVASLESGKLDLVISDLNVTDERKEVILMSEPYMVSEIAVMVQRDRLGNQDVFANIDDLDGQVIGVLGGASYDTDIQNKFPNATLLYYPTYVDCIAAINSGKVDAYITDEPLVRTQIDATGGLTYFPEKIANENYAFIVSKENMELQQEINGALAELEKEGVLNELKKEWIEGEGTQSVDRNLNADNSKGTLTVMTSCDVEPFTYVSADGEIVGYEIELMVRVAEYLGYDVEFRITEFSALMPAIKEGKADVVTGCLAVTEERMEEVLFSDTIYESGPVAVILSGENEKTTFLEDIKDSFYRTFIKENRWKLLRDGLIVTIQLSIVSVIIGTILGFIVSFPLRSKNAWIKGIANAISTFLDGMPLVVILMVLYYIVFKSIDIPAMWVGIIGFSLDFANTVAGLLNTGVLAVDSGQLEAAEAMGYNKRQVFCKITFPQAAKQMFSQYEGAVVGLVKGTSIIGYITVEDLTKAGDIIRSRTYEAFFPLIVTAVLYFLLAYLFVLILKRVDIKIDPKRRPRMVKGVHTGDNN